LIEAFYAILDIGLVYATWRLIARELERKHSTRITLNYLLFSSQSPVSKADLIFLCVWILNGIFIILLLIVAAVLSYQVSAESTATIFADVITEFCFVLSVFEAFYSCYAMFVVKRMMGKLQRKITQKGKSALPTSGAPSSLNPFRKSKSSKSSASHKNDRGRNVLSSHQVYSQNSNYISGIAGEGGRDLEEDIIRGGGEDIIDYSHDGQNFGFYSQAGLESIAREEEEEERKKFNTHRLVPIGRSNSTRSKLKSAHIVKK
jgi:hypothetical protein